MLVVGTPYYRAKWLIPSGNSGSPNILSAVLTTALATHRNVRKSWNVKFLVRPVRTVRPVKQESVIFSVCFQSSISIILSFSDSCTYGIHTSGSPDIWQSIWAWLLNATIKQKISTLGGSFNINYLSWFVYPTIIRNSRILNGDNDVKHTADSKSVSQRVYVVSTVVTWQHYVLCHTVYFETSNFWRESEEPAILYEMFYCINLYSVVLSW